MKDVEYYELLEVSKTANADEIKKAYRKLAMKYHPDRNQGDKEAEEMFKVVNEAYQVLSDPQKRALYDKYGKSGLESSGFRGFSDRGFDDVFEDLSSIFESVFGGGFSGGGRKKQQSGDKYSLDLAIELNLSFQDAVFGCKKEIEFEYKTPCETCNGTGAKDGKLESCASCGGRGQVFARNGFMTFAQTCPACKGAGVSAKEPCKKCHGKGFDLRKEKVEINIPEGVDNGNKIRVGGKGNIGSKGGRGDLYLVVSVADDDHFVRHNDDIYIEVPVFFTQIPLEDTMRIHSLKGELELKLPKDAKDKQQFTFRGEGVKNVHSGMKGNLVAQLKIVYPQKLSDEQRELLEKLHKSFGYDGVPNQGMFEQMFEKIKGWFALDDESSEEQKSGKK